MEKDCYNTHINDGWTSNELFAALKNESNKAILITILAESSIKFYYLESQY